MANSFNPLLNSAADKIIKEEEEQEKLHKKFKDVPKDTKIVLKAPNKTRVEVLGRLWPLVLILLVFTLAVTIYAFVVPEIREYYIQFVRDIILYINDSFHINIPTP